MHTRTTRRGAKRHIAASLVVLSLTVAACGGDDDDATSEPATATATTATDTTETAETESAGTASSDAASSDAASSDAASSGTASAGSESAGDTGAGDGSGGDDVLGTPRPATAAAVKVGFISEGQTDAIDNSQQVPLAEATAAYANDYLGGLGGHEIEVVGCETKGTPEGATECINQLIQADVVAAVLPQFSQSAQATVALNDAGIPVVLFQAGSPEELTAPMAYSIGGGIVSLAGSVGANMLEQGQSKLAVLMIDVAAVSQAVTALAVPAYEAAGITSNVIAIAPGTADMTPYVSAAELEEPDAYWVFGNEPFCIAGGQALVTLGIEDRDVYYLNNCISTALGEAVDIEGALTGSAISLAADDPEFELYQAVVAAYGPDITDDPNKIAGAYAPLLALARVMEDVDGDVTAATIDQAMAAAKDVPAPLGGGNTFTCGGTVFPALPAYCSVAAFVTPLNADGSPAGYRPVDTSTIFGS